MIRTRLRVELLGHPMLTQELPQFGHVDRGSLRGWSTTQAQAVSPRRSSGSGTRATSLMAGWVRRRFSISTTGMFSPPRMMMSLVRPQIRMCPSASSSRARSPVFR